MWYDAQREVRQVQMESGSEWDAKVLNHPDAAGLHEMWTALRGDRPVPFRAELDAGRIGAKAPFLAILEYVGPSNFRIRIAGDRLNKWFGMELRGMSALSLTDTAARNHFQATLNRVTAEPAVGVLHGTARGVDMQSLSFEMILLPMRSDFGRVDRVLVGLWMLGTSALMHGPLRLEPDEFIVSPIADPSHAMEGATSQTQLRESAVTLSVVATASTADPEARAAPPASDAGEEGGSEDKPPRPTGSVGPGRRGHLRLVSKT